MEKYMASPVVWAPHMPLLPATNFSSNPALGPGWLSHPSTDGALREQQYRPPPRSGLFPGPGWRCVWRSRQAHTGCGLTGFRSINRDLTPVSLPGPALLTAAERPFVALWPCWGQGANRGASGSLPQSMHDPPWIHLSLPPYNHKEFDLGIPEWSSGFPYFLQFNSEFDYMKFMIWARVSSQSCVCWLYRASPSSAAKNIINLISILTMGWCPCIELSLVLLGEGVCYDQYILLAKLCSPFPYFIL